MSAGELSKLEGKIERIAEEIGTIRTTLAVNTESLKQHMSRTELLERRMDSIWARALTGISIISALIVLVKSALG